MLQTGASSRATAHSDSPGHESEAFPHSHRSSWLIPTATVLGFAIPAVAYLWMIHAYAVNVVYFDQWDNVILIGHAFSGTLSFSTLWAQHYEDRVFFPNLIVLALAYTTHLNVVTEEYVSALMLFGATALVICAHKRRSPGRRWIWYCPVAFLLLSLAQAVNTLFGFQLCWYLVLLTVALALFLLDREPPGWPVFGAAVAAAMVASFSSFKGLLVWPAGLLLLYLRCRSRRQTFAWLGFALLAGVIYFVGFNFNAAGQSSTSDSAGALTFFLRVVGDVLGDGQPGVWVTVFGLLLVVTAIWALVRFGIWGRTRTGGRPFALSLILFGLLFSAITAYGRSGLAGGLGLHTVGVESHYTVFAILVLVGLYLAVLDPPLTTGQRPSEGGSQSVARRASGWWQASSGPLFVFARVVVGVGVVLTVVLGTLNGTAQARSTQSYDRYLARVIVRANQYPAPVLAPLAFQSAQSIRSWVTIARRDRLSLFDTGDATTYLSEPPLNLYRTAFHATLILPHDGATLHGKQVLDVTVLDSFDVTRVDYLITGPGTEAVSLSTSVGTHYGWITVWHTSTVPNGSYVIRATVHDSGGRSFGTSSVDVRVEN